MPRRGKNEQLDPAIRRKIRQLRIFGIGAVLVLWLLVVASFLGYLPWKLGVLLVVIEVIAGPILINKARALRNSA